jgi:hypothetical protein
VGLGHRNPNARLVLFCRFGVALNLQINSRDTRASSMTLMSADIGLLNDASPSRIGGLPDAALPPCHLLRPRITKARFTPANAIDARMKNRLPSGAYFPFPLTVILRCLNDILRLFHCRCALKILSSTVRTTRRVFNSARWIYYKVRKLSAVSLC